MEAFFKDFKYFLKDKKKPLDFMKANCPAVHSLLYSFIDSLEIIEEIYNLTDSFKDLTEDYGIVAEETYRGVMDLFQEFFLTFEEWMSFSEEAAKTIDKAFYLYILAVDKLAVLKDKEALDKTHALFVPRNVTKEELEGMVEFLTNKIVYYESNVKPEKDVSMFSLATMMEIESSIIKRHLLAKKHEN